MRTVVNVISGRMETTFDADVRAVIDTWSDYGVTREEFRQAVLQKGIAHSKAHRGRAWIVDSSRAKGVFSPDIQDFIAAEVFPAFAANGVKYFITITSQSALTRLTIKSYQAKAGPHGLQLVEVNSLEDAIAWLAARPD